MARTVEVAAIEQVPEGHARVVRVDEREVALYNVGGRIYATENTCCHRGGPLGEGELEGTTIRCPWHLWEFDVVTGACGNAPGMRVRTYLTQVRDGRIFVTI